MESIEVIKEVIGRRGRGPGRIVFQSGLDLSSFDGDQVRQAAQSVGKEANVKWEEKPSKDGTKTYKNLITMEIKNGAEPVKSEELILVPTTGSVLAPTDGTIEELEKRFAYAVRQRELLEEFVQKRMRKNIHFMDGKVFGSDKPVLLQPGAQLILYCHGLALDFQVLSLPIQDQKPDGEFTVVIKAEVKNAQGRIVGSAIGSASSHIWSNRQARYVLRAVDPDKAANSTMKMAQKRALVSACNNATASSEFFAIDIEEGGYGEAPLEEGQTKKFIKRT